jgi:hypothetical protein
LTFAFFLFSDEVIRNKISFYHSSFFYTLTIG